MDGMPKGYDAWRLATPDRDELEFDTCRRCGREDDLRDGICETCDDDLDSLAADAAFDADHDR